MCMCLCGDGCVCVFVCVLRDSLSGAKNRTVDRPQVNEFDESISLLIQQIRF